MHIIRNERRIKMRSSIGQYATFAGLAGLVGGLAISVIRPTWFVPMLASVTLGFTFSIVGGFFAGRYLGPLAHHTALVENLKGLDRRYTLFQYVLPVPHVLLEPGGCTVFVVKPQEGRVSYEGGKWKHQQRSKFFRQLAGQEGIVAPHAEAEQQVRKLERYLGKRLPDVEVPVRAVILFIGSDVTFDADDSPVPVFYRKKVKSWLRGPGNRKPLSADLHRQLAEALGAEQEEGG
jgi:hypothetical protein